MCVGTCVKVRVHACTPPHPPRHSMGAPTPPPSSPAARCCARTHPAWQPPSSRAGPRRRAGPAGPAAWPHQTAPPPRAGRSAGPGTGTCAFQGGGREGGGQRRRVNDVGFQTHGGVPHGAPHSTGLEDPLPGQWWTHCTGPVGLVDPGRSTGLGTGASGPGACGGSQALHARYGGVSPFPPITHAAHTMRFRAGLHLSPHHACCRLRWPAHLAITSW